jgi:hypothetical protein
MRVGGTAPSTLASDDQNEPRANIGGAPKKGVQGMMRLRLGHSMQVDHIIDIRLA